MPINCISFLFLFLSFLRVVRFWPFLQRFIRVSKIASVLKCTVIKNIQKLKARFLEKRNKNILLLWKMTTIDLLDLLSKVVNSFVWVSAFCKFLVQTVRTFNGWIALTNFRSKDFFTSKTPMRCRQNWFLLKFSHVKNL